MFFTPVTTFDGAGAANGYLDAVKSYIAAGSKRFSAFDLAGQAELLERLQETLGINNSFQGTSFNRAAFDQYNFILAYDQEKAGHHAKGSGMNLSHGQLLTIHAEGVGSVGNYVQRAYTTARYDAIIELTSTGCVVHS